jgi:hypothetical protein
MSDVFELLVRPLAVAVLWVLRALLWLGWDLMFSTIGWCIGWCMCRAVTLGRWPGVGINEEDDYDLLPRIVVELVGLLALAALIWWLAGVLGA